jgi:hypothetical protein
MVCLACLFGRSVLNALPCLLARLFGRSVLDGPFCFGFACLLEGFYKGFIRCLTQMLSGPPGNCGVVPAGPATTAIIQHHIICQLKAQGLSLSLNIRSTNGYQSTVTS